VSDAEAPSIDGASESHRPDPPDGSGRATGGDAPGPASWSDRLRGPWRVAVREASMLPAIAPGDWLLVDPLVRRWPRRGSVVVIREPGAGQLALKRVAARSGARVAFADGWLHLGREEAWLLSDADEDVTAAAGFGPPIDSRTYGPVSLDRLVARAWFRYGPVSRVGRIPGRP
jgi:hypothetical protein